MYEELPSQGTHCLYTFIESEVRKWPNSQSGKSDKTKTIGTKLYEELRSQDTQGKCGRMDGQTNGWKLARLSRPC